MSQDHAALDGLLGIGADAEGRAFYLRVAAGDMAYDRGGETFDYIQVFLYQEAAPGRPADANDMFETDGLEELADELRSACSTGTTSGSSSVRRPARSWRPSAPRPAGRSDPAARPQ
ncbi:hypothetical protein ACM614_27710 [Streptomyces sp. 12297]